MNKRINKLQTIANKYRVKVTFNANETEDKNNGGFSGNEIWLGEFDDVDLLTIAFFHELAHCLSQTVLNHRKYYSSRLADEGFAWEYGFELASQYGYTWDIKHKVYKYAEKNLLSYVNKETVRTCINCKRAEKFDDNFIKCDGLIHVSMAQEMADGCLQYLPHTNE